MPEKVTVWVQSFKDRSNLMLQWFDPETGRRKSKSAETADPAEAEDKRKDLEYELRHDRYQEASKMTWERFRELLEEEFLPDRKKGTQGVFLNVLNLFEEISSPKSLRAITARTISGFAAGLRKRKGRRGHAFMQPSTIKVTLQFLHTVLRWAVKQGLLPKMPEFPTISVATRTPRPVPTEAFDRLLAKAPDDQMRAFLLCGWLAGLRRNEALYLEWHETDEAPWLDMAHNRIILPEKFVKAQEDQWVPLDPDLRAALEKLPRHRTRVFRFVSRSGRELTPSTVSGLVVDLAKQAGVKLAMHTLRKGFGCRYAGKVPAQVLQKLMRHSDIKITMKYYANVDDAVEQAVLGNRCNSLRNSGTVQAAAGGESPTESPYQEKINE
jgi:integrase